MNRRLLLFAIGVPLTTAVLGNALIPADALTWYGNLNHPWYKLPLWGSAVVALLVYVGYGIILYRTRRLGLETAVWLAVAALVGNELWNVVFFGTQNLSLTFWVTLAFGVLILVQTLSVWKSDKLAFRISFVYLAWVLLYDVPWLYQLSTMNG